MNLFLYLLAIAIAILAGKLIQKISMPAILGWLIAGIILGPNVLNLIQSEYTDTVSYGALMVVVNILVGMMLGSNLDWQRIKKSGKKMVTLSLSEILTTFILITVLFLFYFHSQGVPWFIALLMGGIAIATAPAPPLSIVNEYSTEGPLTRTLVPLTILNSVIVNIVFFTLASVIESTISEASGSILWSLTLMLFIPIIYGAVTGAIASIFVDKEQTRRRNVLSFFIFGIIMIGLAIYINQVIYPRPAMNYILVGIGYMAAFVNLTSDKVEDQIYKYLGNIETIALLLLIINIAAPLDPKALISGGWIAILYIIFRWIGKWIGIFVPAKVMGLDENVQKYGGVTMFSHAGISLVLAGAAAEVASIIDPSYGQSILTILPTAAIINEFISIFLTTKVFEWSGETHSDEKDNEYIDSHSNYRYQSPEEKNYH